MSPERRREDQIVTRKECSDRHTEERMGRRWAIGLLSGALLAVVLSMIGTGLVIAETNGSQNAQLAERAKGEERILDGIAELRTLIMENCRPRKGE